MKFYFAGGLIYHNQINPKSLGVNRVLSSWLEKKQHLYPLYEIFLDSGAFTAETQGIHIELKDYIAHIKENITNLKVYANLDVIYNAEKTYENYLAMGAEGLNPLPVYHQGEDKKFLLDYLENSDYIALGGLVGSGRSILEPFLDNCFSIIKNYWPKKIHGFGINALWALKKYPFYSIDSTSWMPGGRYGSIYSSPKISEGSMKKDINSFMYTKTLNYKEMAIINIKQFLQLEKDIVYYWKRRGIVWED